MGSARRAPSSTSRRATCATTSRPKKLAQSATPASVAAARAAPRAGGAGRARAGGASAGDRRAALQDRAHDPAPGGRGRAALRRRHGSGDRRCDQAGARAQDRQAQASAWTSRSRSSVRTWSRSRSRRAWSPRSRPWSWTRLARPRRRSTPWTVAPRSPQAPVPPQNIEAEESVLGAMLIAEGAIAPVVVDLHLRAGDFYRESHRAIFRAIIALYEQERGGRPADRLRRARGARRARARRAASLRSPARRRRPDGG